MNREQMEAVIHGGGSVLHGGKLHTRIATLPTSSSLAKTDEEKAKSEKELDDKIESLLKEREALRSAELLAQTQNKQIEGGKPDNQNGDNNKPENQNTGNVKTDAETPESLLKLSPEDLLKRAGEVGKATNQQFDPKATKEVLVKFILSGANKQK